MALSAGNFDSKSQYFVQDTVSQQIVVSNGILTPDKFSISQTGTPKTTLLGNTIVNLIIDNDQPLPVIIASFDALMDGDKVKAPAKTKLSLQKSYISVYDNDIKGVLRITYSFRNVTKGEKTYSEQDDEVCFYKGQVSKHITLARKKDVMQRLYKVQDNTSNSILHFLDTKGLKKKPFVLYFKTLEETENFIDWLSIILPDSKDDVVFNGRYKLVTFSSDTHHPIPLKRDFDTAKLVAKDEE